MAKQTCPKCGTQFSTSEGWGKAALSLLMPAPAVPDMATQVRCPQCQHLFAEIRHLRSFAPRGSWLLVLVVVTWAIYELFRR